MIKMKACMSLFLVLVMATTLIACGGVNSVKDNVNAERENNVTPDSSVAVDESQTEEPIKPAVDGKIAGTMDIELEVEGVVETRLGTLAVSDNGYYLYTLPDFKFTPEEPNVDQVYMDEHEDHYMRIIPLGNEPELAEIRANSEEELSMLGTVHALTGEQIGESALRDAIFYSYASDSILNKYIIVRETDGMYYKFIVNIPSSEAQEDVGPSFSAMIMTIQPMKP